MNEPHAFPFPVNPRPRPRPRPRDSKPVDLRIHTRNPRLSYSSHGLPQLTEARCEEDYNPPARDPRFDHFTISPTSPRSLLLYSPPSSPEATPGTSRSTQSVFTASASRPCTGTIHTTKSPSRRFPRLHTRSLSDTNGVRFSIDALTAAYEASSQRDRERERFASHVQHPNSPPATPYTRPPMALTSPPRATFDAGPDSPPELTSSKSSKSSSFRTRSSGDDDSSAAAPSPHDASNFEDITLDDILARQGSNGVDADAADALSATLDPKDRHGSLPLALPRTRSAISSRHASISSTATVTIRDLTGAPPRPQFAGVKRQAGGSAANGISLRGSQSALHLPAPGSPRRSFTNPVPHSAHPGFNAPPLYPPANRSRSPSPTFLQSFGLSAQHHLPRRSSSRSSLRSDSTVGPAGRRGSWQPGRKTVQELEDEYDDNDEDIPEDAIVWNIPLSPRPLESRSVSQSPERAERRRSERSTSSRRSLRSPTPQQELQPRSPPESGSILALRRQRSTPAFLEDVNGGLSKPRPGARPSPLRHAATDTTGLNGALAHRSRIKSWTDAMGELSSEAQELTAALEAYETQQEKKVVSSVTATEVEDPALEQSGADSTAPSTSPPPVHAKPALRRPASTVELRQKVTLPPIRKGDMLLDPLPISKEKEKVLTRTRPSWLPPKSKKEEKRHLKEYKQMMEASIEAEKKREQRLQMEQEAKEAQEASLRRIWENTVLEDWESSMAEPRTRELWWRGVPSQYRGQVWAKAVGNELHLTETSYNAALARAKEERRRLEHAKAQAGPDVLLKAADEARLLQYRTMHTDVLALAAQPGYHIFAATAPLHDPLMDLLSAYASYRNDVGYVTGIHLPAALLLSTFTPTANAFILLANILNRPVPMSYLLTTLRHRAHLAPSDIDDPDQHDSPDIPAPVATTHALVLKQLANKLPSLHAHLTSPKTDLRPAQYLDPLLATLLCDPRRVGLEHALRAWDVMAFEGDKVLVRGAVAVLARLEGKLYGGRDEILGLLGWEGGLVHGAENGVAPELGDAEAWMKALREAGKVEKKEDD